MKTTVTSLLTICALCALSVMTPAGVCLAGNIIQTAAQTEPIPWSEIGAKAGAQYRGNGLSISPTETGALLRCVFQRLEGEATAEGLWLTSTVEGPTRDRFRIVARAVGRQPQGFIADCRLRIADVAVAGTVSTDSKVVRLIRPGVTEEYSVSMDGVRQDFIIQSPPQLLTPHSSLLTSGELRVELEVTGAGVEPAHYGARLVLENSGRKIAYSRLLVVDATGRELPARMEVASATPSLNSQSSTLNIFVNDTDAVYPIRIDPTFSDENWISMGAIPGAGGGVHAAVVDASGNLYIGGTFTVVGDVIANRIAKWDGSNWSALGSGLDLTVYALAVSGRDLYAGGNFRTAGGKVSAYLAKWATAEIVLPANAISPQFLDDSDFVVRFAASPGITYTIEYTEDVWPANWQKATNITAPGTDLGLGVGVFEFRDSSTAAPQRFYRAVYPAY